MLSEIQPTTYRSEQAVSKRPSSTRLWRGYTRTHGLEQFRRTERYNVWIHTHRELVGKDAQYAQSSTRFHIQMVAAWIFALITFFTLTSTLSAGVSMAIACSGGIILAGIACRAEQTRRNRSIGKTIGNDSATA